MKTSLKTRFSKVYNLLLIENIIQNMKSINEYLLGKNKKSSSSLDELKNIIRAVIDDAEDCVTQMTNEIVNYVNEKRFDDLRYLCDDASKDKTISKFTANLMTLDDNGDIIQQLFENIKDDMHQEKTETYEGDNDDYEVYYGKTYILISSSDFDLLIDTIPDGEDVDPDISVYHVDHSSAIELSDKALGNYFHDYDYDTDGDYVWDVFNNMAERYIEDFQEEYGVELVIGGRGGKHVCCRGNYKVIHEFNKFIKTIEDWQADLLNEINEWIDENIGKEDND